MDEGVQMLSSPALRAACLSLLLGLCMMPAARCEEEKATPWPKVFRDSTAVEVVNLDVFVRDRSGEPVRGLEREDFELRLQGEPIDLSNFYAVAGGELPLDEAAAAVDEEGDGLVVLQRRLLVIYVDNANLTVSGRARAFEHLREFLLDQWSPDLDVLVASNGGSQTETALRVLQGLTNVPHEAFFALEQLQDIAPGGQRFDVEERQLVRELESINGDVAAGFVDVKGDETLDRSVGISAATNRAQAILPRLREQAQLRYDHVLQSLGVLRQLIDLSLGVPRRTSLLYVGDRLALRPGEALLNIYGERVANIGALSAGLSVDMEAGRYDATSEFLELVRLANSGGLTFYGLNASPSATVERGGAGATTNIWSPSAAGLVERGRRESQHVLADGTGGRASRSAADVGAVLSSVMQDFNDYYSLGFRLPPGLDAVTDIEARVVRQGLGKLDIRTRQSLSPRGSDEVMGQRALAALLLDSLDDPLGVSLEALPATSGAGDLLAVPLRLGIPLGELVLVPDGPEHRAAVSVYVAARDEQGRTSRVLHHQCPIRIPNDELLMALGRSALCGLRLQMRPQKQTVAVVVHDENAARTSTLRLDLELSASTTRAATATDSSTDEPEGR